ncbi:MAG: ABC transporter ATP-binding protein [Thaumarchaeota archaeon]|nr:ABC transporter ATP-binding protein [Nitrososphaerota archaeon]
MSVLEGATKQSERESVPPAVKITDLYKRYSGRKRGRDLSPRGFLKSILVGKEWETIALDRVSLTVEHGDVFGLLGPNGSGKTTMIKILANLVIPDSGTAYVEGINVVRRPYAAAKRLQTVLAESIGLEKRVTVRQNLQLFASLYGLPKQEANERIDRLLDYFGLSEVTDKQSQSLSTGMSRKLSICRVLLSNASVVVFDEPTSGLDPSAAENLRELLVRDLVKREKKTIIIATHNLAEANSICTRIALLNRGRLIALGSPEEIRRSVQDQVDIAITITGADGNLEELREKLGKVDGVFSVELVERHQSKQIRLTGRKDMRYLDVFSLVSARGLEVLSMETSSPSLEDAFIRLTREAKK